MSRIGVIFRTTVKKKFTVEVVRITPDDLKRLLVLWVWSERYHLPLTYVIEVLVGRWRGITTRHRRKSKVNTLGVRVITLTSRKSEQMLVEHIQQHFPNHENEFEWRLQKQLRLLGLDEQWGRVQSFVDVVNPESVVRLYRRRVNRRARLLSKANAAHWRRHRHWRGNPWL